MAGAVVGFTDSGLLCHVLGVDENQLASPFIYAGHIVESFVLSELGRQLDWSSGQVRLHHYRTRDGVEVDALHSREPGVGTGTPSPGWSGSAAEVDACTSPASL